MQFKQKLAYMAIGSVFTLLGFILASMVGNVTAQDIKQSKAILWSQVHQSVEFDKITCRQLEIVDTEGKPQASIGSTKDGGLVKLLDNKGEIHAIMSVSPDGDGGVVNLRGSKPHYYINSEPAGALPKTSERSTTPTCAYCERYNKLIGNYPLCTGPGAECDQQSPCGCFRGCQ